MKNNQVILIKIRKFMDIFCPRCQEINPISNTNCKNCNSKDIARAKIIEQSLWKPLGLSFLSVLIAPLNIALGIFIVVLSITATINFYIGSPLVIILTIGKVLTFFDETTWVEVGLAWLSLIFCGLIVAFYQHAFDEGEGSKTFGILRFLIFFCFPPILIFSYFYYYKPRLTALNIAKEIERLSEDQLDEDEIRKLFMARYKKRDEVLSEAASYAAGNRKEHEFYLQDNFKYFSFEKYEGVLLGYGLVVCFYVYLLLDAIGLV